jgi:hypothetical protein
MKAFLFNQAIHIVKRLVKNQPHEGVLATKKFLIIRLAIFGTGKKNPITLNS